MLKVMERRALAGTWAVELVAAKVDREGKVISAFGAVRGYLVVRRGIRLGVKGGKQALLRLGGELVPAGPRWRADRKNSALHERDGRMYEEVALV